MVTRIHLVVLALVTAATPSCDNQKSSASQSIAKALDAPKKEIKPVSTADDKPKAPKAVDPMAAPWNIDQIRGSLVAGTKLTYARSGVDAKGKKVGGELVYVLRGSSNDGATTSYTVEPDPGTNKASSQAATVAWSNDSPFFAMEKPTTKITGREKVAVPAGEFETSVAELDDFFGNHKRVWMIVDKPGVYAKVLDDGSNDPADKTAITLELKTIAVPQ